MRKTVIAISLVVTLGLGCIQTEASDADTSQNIEALWLLWLIMQQEQQK